MRKKCSILSLDQDIHTFKYRAQYDRNILKHKLAQNFILCFRAVCGVFCMMVSKPRYIIFRPQQDLSYLELPAIHTFLSV